MKMFTLNKHRDTVNYYYVPKYIYVYDYKTQEQKSLNPKEFPTL